MSFAGFNSGKFVKGRLQAALYFMRKKNRARRNGGDLGTTPDAFVSDDWSIADLQTGTHARITIVELPFDGGSPLTDLEYSADGGPWTSLGGTTIGEYDIGGLVTGELIGVVIRAVNVHGPGPASNSEAVTPTAPVIFFGAQTTGGDGNWGHGVDRAMFRRLTLTAPDGEQLTIKAVHVAIRTAGDGSMKGLVYSDLGTATPVGEQLGVSAPQLTTVAGYKRCPVADIVVPSGTNVWGGAVWGPSGTGTGEFDSELVPAAPNTIMFNNTFNYDTPPADAPATADPNYANTLACFIECTYIPN